MATDPLVLRSDSIGAILRRQLQSSVLEAFREARGELQAALQTLPPQEAIDVAEVWNTLSDGLLPIYAVEGEAPLLTAMYGEGPAIAAAVGVPWAAVDAGYLDRVATYLVQNGAATVTAIADETREALRGVLADLTAAGAYGEAAKRILEIPGFGLSTDLMAYLESDIARIIDPVNSAGWSGSQIDFAIRQKFNKWMNYRARRIAVTEGRSAGNVAVDLFYREASARGEVNGALYELEWVVRGPRPCVRCSAMRGIRRSLKGGLFISEPLASGKQRGQRISAERPLLHPWCNCALRVVRIRA